MAKVLKFPQTFAVLLLLILLSLPLYVEQAHAQGQSNLAVDSAELYQSLIDSNFVYGNQGEYDRAESCLKRAIAIQPRNPLNPMLLNNLAAVQELQSKYDEALLSYSAALEREPSEQTIRANRARLFVTMGNLKAAITDYALLVAQDPSNEVYKYQRAMVYILDKGYDLAELDLSTILQSNPKSLKARIGMAMLRTIQGRYDEAERLYDYLIERLPSSAEVYEGRARLYYSRGMRGYALRDLQKAVELSRGNPSASLLKLRDQIHASVGG